MTNPTNNLALSVGPDLAFDVRSTRIEEKVSTPFSISAIAVHADSSIDFETVVGQPATFTLTQRVTRTWHGVVRSIEQLRTEADHLSTYQLHIVPALWLLAETRNYRIFQQQSELEIARAMLVAWRIPHVIQMDPASSGKREYRVQYAESDFAFLSRMLEDAGASYFFETSDDETRMVITDAPQTAAALKTIPFHDQPGTQATDDFATKLRVGRVLSPGRYTMGDRDFRLAPTTPLRAESRAGASIEASLERFHFRPGAFSFGAGGGDTPAADDHGAHRSSLAEAGRLVERRLASVRANTRATSFESNAYDLAPGAVIGIQGHPHQDVVNDKGLLVVGATIDAALDREWKLTVEARDAREPYHPPRTTPKPVTRGVESAMVVGPGGDEIHADEFGRVRVHFYWDREGPLDDGASCWIPTSQPWAGTGFGGVNLPRVGQEVIVDFLGGDPDKPVVTGRIYTATGPVPYGLPANKTQSGWKSNSTGGGGGYNELMFEDAGGAELVRMQAERDLNKLVKNDETVTIGNDRKKLVRRDDIHDVERDRKRTVARDESVAVGNDERREVAQNRTRSVGLDESVTVGQTRTKRIGKDENVSVGENRVKDVGQNETVSIGENRVKNVGANESVNIGASRTKNIGANESVNIGASRTKNIGDDEAVTIGKSRSKHIGQNEVVSIGQNRSKQVGGNENWSIARDLVKSIGNDFVKNVLKHERETTGLSRTVVVGVNRATQIGNIDSTVVGEIATVMIAPAAEGDAGATSWTMQKDLIKLETPSGASITLEGNKIILRAVKIEAHASDGILIESAASDTIIKGAPMVKLNP